MKRLLLILLPLLLLAAPASADVKAEEHWYVIKLQGQRAGWMREYVEPAGENNIRTGAEMRFAFGRGAQQAAAEIRYSFVETPAGEPVSMRMTQKLGAVPSTTEFVFKEDGVTMTSENAGQTFTQTMPLPEGEWLTPMQAFGRVARAIEEGEKEITYRMVSPLTGPAPTETTTRFLGEDDVEVFGRTVPAVKAAVSTPMMAGQESITHIDRDGRTLRAEQPFGAMTMVVVAADKALALSELDPPEMMQSTFVKPAGVPIESPRDATRVRYRLTLPDGDLPPAFVGGAQTADEEDGAVLVTVDLRREDNDPARPEHLASTSMLAASDPVVTQLARRATEGAPDTPADRALALRRFVYDFIDEKSLGVGYASASEVARAGVGDCTEHAVLLAALLRAEGVPSRVVSGLVYTQAFAGAQDVFGYHAWTQAHVDGRWIDLDATLPGRAFDAAHIAVTASAMPDGELANDLVQIAPLLGRLRIETLEIE